tara:strand:- start:2346 stop:2642 length:297 start_codon:yes stop_codon:yes gene_type:complete
MPVYTYRNIKTGEIWDEYLPIADRKIPLKNKNIEQLITAPRLSFIERREHGARDQMINTARKGMKERQAEEKAGIRKSPDWLKERTERHLQKVRNVSS